MENTIDKSKGEKLISVKQKDGTIREVVGIVLEDYLKKGLSVIDALDYPIIDTRIYGGFFKDSLEDQRKLQPGTKLEMKREEDNPFDSYAIAILDNGQSLGYLRKDLSLHVENDTIPQLRCIVLKRYLPERGSSQEKGALIRLVNLNSFIT